MGYCFCRPIFSLYPAASVFPAGQLIKYLLFLHLLTFSVLAQLCFHLGCGGVVTRSSCPLRCRGPGHAMQQFSITLQSRNSWNLPLDPPLQLTRAQTLPLPTTLRATLSPSTMTFSWTRTMAAWTLRSTCQTAWSRDRAETPAG